MILFFYAKFKLFIDGCKPLFISTFFKLKFVDCNDLIENFRINLPEIKYQFSFNFRSSSRSKRFKTQIVIFGRKIMNFVIHLIFCLYCTIINLNIFINSIPLILRIFCTQRTSYSFSFVIYRILNLLELNGVNDQL